MDKYIIDVSQWQGKVNWEKTKDVVHFVILRASCGMKNDTRYKLNSLALDQYNIPYHAYHYIKAATKVEARAEAGVFAQATSGSHPLFYVIDAEYAGLPSGDERIVIEEFERELRKLVGEDIRVAAYIAHHKYGYYKLDTSRYAYIWIPRYGANTGKPDKEPKYYCDLWQYTSVGRVDGISGDVDMSQIHGDKPLEFFMSEVVKENDEGQPEGQPEGQEETEEATKEPETIFELIARFIRWIKRKIKGS